MAVPLPLQLPLPLRTSSTGNGAGAQPGSRQGRSQQLDGGRPDVDSERDKRMEIACRKRRPTLSILRLPRCRPLPRPSAWRLGSRAPHASKKLQSVHTVSSHH